MGVNKITCDWQGKMAFEAELPGGKIMLDAGDAVGGEGKGVRPKPLVLVALAGCTAMDVASLFHKMKADPEDFKVEVSGELTEEHPKYFHTAHIIYHFWGKDLKKKKLEKSINLSLDRYCGVTEMFRRFSKVTFEVIYHED
jgi:putative redox protein